MEHWGSSRELHPQNLGKNRLPEETQMGSAVTGVFAAPLLPLAEKPPPCLGGQQWDGEESIKPPVWGWSRTSLSWNTAQPTLLPTGWGNSAGHAGDTAVPKP